MGEKGEEPRSVDALKRIGCGDERPRRDARAGTCQGWVHATESLPGASNQNPQTHRSEGFFMAMDGRYAGTAGAFFRRWPWMAGMRTALSHPHAIVAAFAAPK